MKLILGILLSFDCEQEQVLGTLLPAVTGPRWGLTGLRCISPSPPLRGAAAGDGGGGGRPGKGRWDRWMPAGPLPRQPHVCLSQAGPRPHLHCLRALPHPHPKPIYGRCLHNRRCIYLYMQFCFVVLAPSPLWFKPLFLRIVTLVLCACVTRPLTPFRLRKSVANGRLATHSSSGAAQLLGEPLFTVLAVEGAAHGLAHVGIEPVTSALGARRSKHLSHRAGQPYRCIFNVNRSLRFF